MKFTVNSLFALFLLVPSSLVQGATFGPEIPIPDENILSNFNGTGLDWVYAGPVAPNEFGPGEIEPPSFRAAEGWRYATQDEWNIRPHWTDFIQPGFTTADVPPVDSWTDHSKYKFASEYWSTFNHVDLNDADDGLLTNGLDIGNDIDVPETWYVRTVPEPSSFVLAAGAIVAFLCCAARGRQTR